MIISRIGTSPGKKPYSSMALSTKKGLTKKKTFKKSTVNRKNSDQNLGELTSDVYPPLFQRSELYDLSKVDYTTEKPKVGLLKRLFCCKSQKIKPQEELKHDSERARKNWKVIKANLLAELFIKKLKLGRGLVQNGDENETLSDEEEGPSWTENIIINPNSRKIYFDYFMSFVALMDLLVNIYCIFVARPIIVFNLLILPLFVTEMVLCSLTTFYVDVALENRIAYIISNYLKKYFLLDFIGTFPFFLLDEVLLSFKLLRIFKLTTYISRINSFIEKMLVKWVHGRRELINSVKKTIRFLIFLLFTMHLLACIWIYIGQLSEENWIEKSDDILENPGSNFALYIAANYWVMSTFTTVGYGDFSGLNNTEYLFNMLVQVLGIGFFGYTIDSISKMMGQIDSISEFQEQEEENQNIWLMKLGRSNKDKILSRHYYDQANSFFSNYWSMDYTTLKNNEFYIQLKPRLQIEVDNICFEEIYERFEGFFKDTDDGFRREICHHLVFEEFRIFPPYNDTYEGDKKSFPDRQKTKLLQDGEIPERIFFIVGGEAYASNTTGRYNYFQLPEGAYFGETHILIGLPLSYSLFYSSEVGCAALTLKTEIFLQICERYPDSFLKLRKRSEKRRKVLRSYKFEALSDIINSCVHKFEGTPDYQKIKSMYDILLSENKEDHIVMEAKNRINVLKTIQQENNTRRSSKGAINAVQILNQEKAYRRHSVNLGVISQFGKSKRSNRKPLLPKISQAIAEEPKNLNTSENLLPEESSSLYAAFDKNLDNYPHLMPDKIEMSELDSPSGKSNMSNKKSMLEFSRSDKKFLKMIDHDKSLKRTQELPEKTRGSAALTDENLKTTQNYLPSQIDELTPVNRAKNLRPEKIEDSLEETPISSHFDKDRLFYSGGSLSGSSSEESVSSPSNLSNEHRRRSMPQFHTKIVTEELSSRSEILKKKFFGIHDKVCSNANTISRLLLKNEILEEYLKDEPKEIAIEETDPLCCIRCLRHKFNQKDHSLPDNFNTRSICHSSAENDQRIQYSELLSMVKETQEKFKSLKEKYQNAVREEQNSKKFKLDQIQAKLRKISKFRNNG
ncbi:unnamed protein product [Moneuplotes crassus]|uniref:Cyclic nucleotide-binding domain-containing protein n=1 Tax=Euplotes crassus TaxID=5936 RepID=A0AAD1XAN3_EUPCR|nr:unnamed protein product [Moneuplotes crassus]